MNSGTIRRMVFSAIAAAGLLTGASHTGMAANNVSYQKCMTCHDDVRRLLQMNQVHAPFKEFDCGSCHDPHTANRGFLIKDEMGRICRSCHENQATRVGYSHEPVRDGNCTNCHDPHASAEMNLLKKPKEALCLGCHSSETLFKGGQKHDPAATGQCLKCHIPHGSDYPAMLSNNTTDTCGACHSVNDALFESEHQKMRVADSDCISCHNPHGAFNKRLIRKQQHPPFEKKNCGACHDRSKPEKITSLKQAGAAVCLTCHSDIGKQFNTVNNHVHGGTFCVDCHAPHASDYQGLTRDTQETTCYRCHVDTRWRVNDPKATYGHPEVRKGNCTACHRPHGSNFRSMLADEEDKVCVSCHKRHATFSHPHGEEAIDPRSQRDISCSTCHDVKGSPYEYAMHMDRQKQLCIQCHASY